MFYKFDYYLFMSSKKSVHRRKIIKQLYFAPTQSCASLSLAIKKSLPLTTRILNELLEAGFVTEIGPAPSTGGRRPIMYSLKQDVFYIVCVAMDQFVTRIAIMDMSNSFVTEVEEIELPLPGNTEALSVLSQSIETVIKNSGISKEKFGGIGIGMPGFVDVKKGINYSFLPTNTSSITEYIGHKTGLPTFIDNDSSLIALAELRFGAARRRKNAMVINIGWGIGLGMILNGELYRGHNGFAGELSHIPIFYNGKLCSCGKTGCLETETSLLVIIQKAREGLASGRLSKLIPSHLEHYEQASESIVSAVLEGDRFAIELFSDAGYSIGRGVAILIHILNPEVIILSGRGSTAGKIWQPPIQQALNEHSIPRLAANTSIETSTLGHRAELIGAATLVMEHYDKESWTLNPGKEGMVSVH